MRQGWTLIETMMVVVIVGFILSIGIPSYIRARDQAELEHKISSAIANGATNVVRIISESKYKPEFLFEYDGCRIYKFYDVGRDIGDRWHYFSKQVDK